jgi:steroid 5-alpha reductase family enzyme
MNGPLRTIFSVTILLLWVLFGIALAQGGWTASQWLLLTLGHICCLVIFVEFAWVFNYGYGLTMLVSSVAIMALHPTPAGLLLGALAAAFGLRMLQFTYTRYHASSYLQSVGRKMRAAPPVKLPAKLFLWVFMSWLMGFELMAINYAADAAVLSGWVIGGAALMLIGLVLETVADQQKQAAKNASPDAFVSGGLFRSVRHANYTGEILFQIGLIVSCLGALSGWLQILFAVLAPAYVIILMIYSAIHGDELQLKRYGSDPDYQAYRASSGRLLPGF